MIRDFTMLDAPKVISLGKQMHEESVYSNLDFDPLRVLELAEQVVNNPQMFMAKVFDDGEIKGFVAAYVSPHFFGNDLTSGDFAVYVLPEFRKGLIGVKLIKSYIEWCDQKGVKEPLLGVSAGINEEKIGKLYRKLGFTKEYRIYKRPQSC